MPYMITKDVEAMLPKVFDQDRMDMFWRPLHSAGTLTPELLAHKPDPYVVDEPRRKRIPDVFEGWTDMWFVRKPVRDAIEALEPGVHEFHEFHVVTEKKRTDLGVFHLLIIKQTIDCVVPEGTDYTYGYGRKGYDLEPVISPLGKVALSPGQARSATSLAQRRSVQKYLLLGRTLRTPEEAEDRRLDFPQMPDRPS